MLISDHLPLGSVVIVMWIGKDLLDPPLGFVVVVILIPEDLSMWRY